MMWGANGNSIQSRIPECPVTIMIIIIIIITRDIVVQVCFSQFRRQSEVHQCGQGHFVCGDCRPRVQTCPTCRGALTGRCHGFEEFMQTLNIN